MRASRKAAHGSQFFLSTVGSRMGLGLSGLVASTFNSRAILPAHCLISLLNKSLEYKALQNYQVTLSLTPFLMLAE